jgi:hypothetical protein
MSRVAWSSEGAAIDTPERAIKSTGTKDKNFKMKNPQ